MATEIEIRRWDQIGGCITEIWTGKTRILIDFGEELPGSKHEQGFAFPWTERKVDAVLFTHYHGDHVGRFVEAYQYTDLYMSKLSRDVLINIHEYLKENLPRLAKRRGGEEAERLRKQAEKHSNALNILKGTGIYQGNNRVHTFQPHKKQVIEIGDIRVTPFWTDHSAADACMFFIETPDKRILHTGDFRGHGALDESGKAIVKEISGFRPVDTIIIEGTMMSRQNEAPYSERKLFEDADRLLKKHKHVFLIISSTNLDSILTFYQAAKENDIAVYCHNSYVERQVRTLGAYAHNHWNMPKMEDVERVRPWDASQVNRMREKGFITMIKAGEPCMELVKQFEGCAPVAVCSMWQGYYLRKLDDGLCKFVDGCKEKGIPVYPLTDRTYGPLHTSGHASPALIEEAIKAAKPEEVRPIHTENAWEFLWLDIDDALKSGLRKRLEAYQMIKKEDAAAKGYSEEKDHRFLGEEALKKFLPDGTHRAFVALVERHHKELAFCFRGNSKDQGTAIIYYKNHIAFAISAKGDVAFDFDHARYSEDWRVKKAALEQFGYTFAEYENTFKRIERKYPSGAVRDSYSIGMAVMLSEQAAALTYDRLEQLYQNYIKDMIESYFTANQQGRCDYFRKTATGEERSAKELTEKIAQQKLFLECKSLNGYFIYDMEFKQRKGKILDCGNQPDMLAIRFDGNGKPERLVFVEVKSKKSALKGSSGVRSHVYGMERYPDWLLPVRGRDACKILNQYMDIGLLKGRPGHFTAEEFAQLPKEVLLIFTGQDTINALGRGQKPITSFLQSMGYKTVGSEEFPQISLNGKSPEPIMIYRKDF